jgi:hypothetical protein
MVFSSIPYFVLKLVLQINGGEKSMFLSSNCSFIRLLLVLVLVINDKIHITINCLVTKLRTWSPRSNRTYLSWSSTPFEDRPTPFYHVKGVLGISIGLFGWSNCSSHFHGVDDHFLRATPATKCKIVNQKMQFLTLAIALFYIF